jgi:hypothetical protein
VARDDLEEQGGPILQRLGEELTVAVPGPCVEFFTDLSADLSAQMCDVRTVSSTHQRTGHTGERKEEIVLSTASGNEVILELNQNDIFIHQL